MDTHTAPKVNGARVQPGSSGLKRSMGIWMATALVIRKRHDVATPLP
jgi:hypothetical protein